MIALASGGKHAWLLVGFASGQSKVERLQSKNKLFSLISHAFQHSNKSLEQASFHVRDIFSGKMCKACFDPFKLLANETNRKHLGNLFSRSHENRFM